MSAAAAAGNNAGLEIWEIGNIFGCDLGLYVGLLIFGTYVCSQ